MVAGIDKAMVAVANTEVPKISEKESAEQLREKTDQFEAIILKMLLDDALKNEKNLFSSENEPGERIYKSMYRDELAKASAGGFGFSQMLFEYLSQKEKS